MKNLIVVGAGGHAGSVADAAHAAGFSVVGFFVDTSDARVSDQVVLNSLDGVDLTATGLALGIGANYSRENAFTAIRNSYPAAQFPLIVHPSAWVSSLARLEEGAVVMSTASVGPGCSVGVGSLINTGSSLDHDSRLASFASLGPGARTGGNVSVGKRTMIGIQAGILQGVTVGSDCVVGGHSFVNSDLDSNIVAWGTPATTVRTRLRDDPYY